MEPSKKYLHHGITLCLTILVFVCVLPKSNASTIYNVNDIQYRIEVGDGSADTGVHVNQNFYYDEQTYVAVDKLDRGYALFYFNLDNMNLYTNRTISKVFMHFELEFVSSAESMFLYGADREWVDNVSFLSWWTRRPQPLGDSISEATPDLTWNLPYWTGGNVDFDITDTFEQWVNDPFFNNGVILTHPGTHNQTTVFTSESGNSAPLLVVQYEPIPEPMTIISMAIACLAGLIKKRF